MTGFFSKLDSSNMASGEQAMLLEESKMKFAVLQISGLKSEMDSGSRSSPFTLWYDPRCGACGPTRCEQ